MGGEVFSEWCIYGRGLCTCSKSGVHVEIRVLIPKM